MPETSSQILHRPKCTRPPSKLLSTRNPSPTMSSETLCRQTGYPGEKINGESTSSTLNPAITRENIGSPSNTPRNTRTTSTPTDYHQQKLSYDTSKKLGLKNPSYTQTSGDRGRGRRAGTIAYITHSPEPLISTP